MKMNDFIFFSGCSYTAGVGIELEEWSQKRYSRLVCNKLGLVDINDAWPGSCNLRIMRQTVNHLLTHYNKGEIPKCVVIMWSDAARVEYFRPQEIEYKEYQDLVQVTPQGIGMTRSYFHRDALENYFAFLSSDTKAVIHSLSYMVNVQAICQLIGSPLIQLQYKSNFKRKIDRVLADKLTPDNCKTTITRSLDLLEAGPSHIVGLKDDFSFAKFLKDNNIPGSTLSLGHPSEVGHAEFANWLLNYIESNNVFTI